MKAGTALHQALVCTLILLPGWAAAAGDFLAPVDVSKMFLAALQRQDCNQFASFLSQEENGFLLVSGWRNAISTYSEEEKEEIAINLGACNYEEFAGWSIEKVYAASMRVLFAAISAREVSAGPWYMEFEFEIIDQQVISETEVNVLVGIESKWSIERLVKSIHLQKEVDGNWRVRDVDELLGEN